MNILIPHSWLLEHLETEATPQQIQELLSLSGPSVERIYDRDGESVYDIEVTTNRVDSMSVRGIAREAAVILTAAGISAHLKPLTLTATVAPTSEALPLPQISDPEGLCKRTLAVVLSHVSRSATPEWMATRLKHVEQNIHDALIDITNYITHDLGHPCHAFDYDKIMALGGEIIVRTATAGKSFTTLDGLTYTTVGGEIVFENGAGEIIDFPAIKGTANTSVDAQTQNVLLWIESLPAEKVRFGSMSHAIRTVAAQLNEKNVDPTLGELVLKKGIELYRSLCGAQQASEIVDFFPQKPTPTAITVPLELFKRYLGISLPGEKITEILIALEFSTHSTEETLTVTPPTFRPDINIPVDVVEEIARIYGYHNLQSSLMATRIPTDYPPGVDFALETKTKRFLAAIGLQEMYTYSLVSEELALQSGFSISEHLKLQNPLTDDRAFLRRSLIPSLREACSLNPTRPDLSVFEFAHTYIAQENQLPEQHLHLSLYIQKPYREARGILESLCARIFFIPELHIAPTADGMQAQISAPLLTGQQVLGTLRVDAAGATAIDLDWDAVLATAHAHPRYQPQPKYPAITEDLTFTLPAHTAIGAVMTTLKTVDTLIQTVQLVDQYKENFTFTIAYRDENKPLSSAEVEPVRKKIVSTLLEKHSGALVGELA
ncbi:phenylalanine--tRNA ligase subunit beta [Candidatus Woesebacteria bacterium]|nr:phenylalanine--tRNA ligase subunit beta [Candidatus Woesebacteria bacterium]